MYFHVRRRNSKNKGKNKRSIEASKLLKEIENYLYIRKRKRKYKIKKEFKYSFINE